MEGARGGGAALASAPLGPDGPAPSALPTPDEGSGAGARSEKRAVEEHEPLRTGGVDVRGRVGPEGLVGALTPPGRIVPRRPKGDPRLEVGVLRLLGFGEMSMIGDICLETPLFLVGPKLTSCSESLELDTIGVSTAPRSRVAGITGFPGALSEDTLNDVVLEADICQSFLTIKHNV